jgi:selenocysteine lyase/cysteine desulfurase
MDGGRLDLSRLAAAARDLGAALVLDATQSIGAAPFDVAAVQPDFLAAGAYKWLLGPYY